MECWIEFDIRYLTFKRFECWIEFDIRNSKALHVFDIKHTKFEFWVEFEVRHSLFKRFKSWIELYIRYLRSLIFYIQNLKIISYSVFTAFLKSDF